MSAREAGIRGRRLLEVALWWPPETFLQAKLRGLASAGMEVTVASTVPRSRAGFRLEGVTLIRIPRSYEPRGPMLAGCLLDGTRLLVTHPRRFRRLVRAIRGPLPGRALRTNRREGLELLRRFARLACLSPEVVHFEWENAAAYYLPVTTVWDCPVVVSARGNLHVQPFVPSASGWLKPLPQLLRRASAIHCVSEAMRAELLNRGALPEALRVIRPAVDTEKFSPARTPSSSRGRGSAALRLVSVGDLDWRKGHEYTLVAVALLRERGVPVHLDLVGDVYAHLPRAVHERERVEETVRDLQLDAEVVRHGRVTQTQIRTLLRDAHACVHSALSEGIPNSVLESMACGVPVAATAAGGTGEAVRDGIDGLLVPLRDPVAMADALERLWRDEAFRTAAGLAARRRVVEEFDLRDQLTELERFYAEVLERGRSVSALDPTPPARAPRPPEELAARPEARRPLRLLTLGELSWRGGHEWMLQAIRRVLDAGLDCTYRIVGQGEHLDAVAFARHQLHLEDHVEIVVEDHLARQRSHTRWADVALDGSVVPTRQTPESDASDDLALITTDRAVCRLPAPPEARVSVVPARDPVAMAAAIEVAARERRAPQPVGVRQPARGPR